MRWRSLVLAGLAAATAVRAQDATIYVGREVPPEVDRMFRKGLEFLVSSQTAEGGWAGSGNAPGITGFALLAMLASGEDPNHGLYAQPIRRGLDFLIRVQEAAPNAFMGPSMYNHGFATLALAEAYGAVRHPGLGPALRKAVDLILDSQAQNPTKGWRYQSNARDADTTVSGAQIVALLAARNAGLEVPDRALEDAFKYLESCQAADGGIGYTSASGPNAVRTAIAVTCAAVGGRKSSRLYQGATEYLSQAQNMRQEQFSGYLFYYLYYASQAYFHMGGEAWEAWNAANIRRLSETQSPNGAWQDGMGREYATATGLLSLALNYRFLPVYER